MTFIERIIKGRNWLCISGWFCAAAWALQVEGGSPFGVLAVLIAAGEIAFGRA